jgi:hypothetical protein
VANGGYADVSVLPATNFHSWSVVARAQPRCKTLRVILDDCFVKRTSPVYGPGTKQLFEVLQKITVLSELESASRALTR